MQTVFVRLLGDPQVRDANGPVACSSKKALGLFCYLAYTGTRQSRRELARLFWGGDADAARASLRTTLLRMPAALTACLAIERDAIGVHGPIDLDTERFLAAARGDGVAALDEAAGLYRGALLAGFEIDASAEFDDWLARERARLRQVAQAAFERLIGLHRDRARLDSAHAAVEREAALATARRWSELEPAAEAAHRWLIRLYLDTQRQDAALAQYETCRRELAVAAGRAPSAETRALVESLLPGGSAPGSAPPPGAAAVRTAPSHGLPGTSFIGRIDELAELERLLGEPDCRLLTLQALGGTGKSRLAAVLADQLAPRFAQGVTWVALDAVAEPAQVPLAIAQALGVELPASAPAAAALCRVLSRQERLLVLDNLEHLLAAPAASESDPASLVLQILREAPGVRMLVTSREVLGVQEEWIYELRGLPCPPAEGAGGIVAGEYAAAELFVQRARQAYPGFSAAAEWPHVVRLCHLVQGLPLALELVAAWVRTLPCGDLVGAIEAELRRLASPHRDRPARQQSLDAVVRTSWTLLAPEQQRALLPLSIFAGGFTHEAAAEIAEAPLRALSALVDKSLVHRRADGRLVLHALVRQFLEETLRRQGGDEARLLQRRHAAWFAALLARLRAQLDAAQGLDAHAALTAELPNLLAAEKQWDLAAEGDRVGEPWLYVMLGRGMNAQALAFADRVLGHAGRLLPETRAQVLIQRGIAHVGLGEGALGDADLARAIALAREHALPNVLATALVYLTLVGFLRDDTAYVQARLDELDAVLPGVDDPVAQVRARFYRGMHLETTAGDAAAAHHYEETLALAQRLGVSQQMQATVRTVLARVLLRLERLDEAQALLGAALAVHERAGNAPRLAQALTAQATALLWSGGRAQAEEAERLAARALALHEQSGHPPGISSASHVLGLAKQTLGDRDAARRLLERAAEVQSPALRNEAEVDLGMLLLASGHAREAAALALACVERALAHDLAGVRHGAALLACAVLSRQARHAPAARRWLRALAEDPGVAFDARRSAKALLASAPPTAGEAAAPARGAAAADATAVEAPRPFDRDALAAMRDALR